MNYSSSKKIFLKLGFFILGVFILSNAIFANNAYAEEQEMGSVLVCKILVDQSGNIIKSNQVFPTNFFLKISNEKNFTSPLVNVSYSTNSFTLNEHFLSDSYDSNCQSFDLPFGQYYYSSETISDPAFWGNPKYFDGLNFNSLSQAKEYSPELFNSDESDDILTNISSDGVITISDENPYRSIILVNTYLGNGQQVSVPSDTFNLVATSIVCDSESDLPNWGKNGSTDITATTSSEFLASHPNCRPLSGFNFEWILGYMDSFVPNGNYVGPATTTGFTVFGPTNQMGVASATITVPKIAPEVISVREVLQDGYIPFKFDINTNPSNEDNYSAELYCHNDVINYDNYDVVALPLKDKTYYCISFNVLKNSSTTPNTAPLISLIGNNPISINNGDLFIDPGATSTDLEDGDLTSQIITSGFVNTTESGTYTLTYTVTDSGGLSASTTRDVVVIPKSLPNDTARIVVSSIVCDSESDLPNWGLGNDDITSSTTLEFLDNNINCRLASGWSYQWGYKGAVSTTTHDFIGELPLSSGFKTFGPTNENGIAFIDVKMATTTPIVIRQVSKDGFIPFAGYENGNVSAELYCYSDVFNYDNIEEIIGLNENQTVYCVSFNAPISNTHVNTPPTISLIGNNPFEVPFETSFVDPGATATDTEDGNLTPQIVITGTVGTIPGTYTLIYTVTDSGGLSASTTRTVIVKEPDTTPKGTVKFCAVFVDKNNTIQTSKENLPFGNFSVILATSTDINGTVYGQKTWSNSSFNPNQKLMSSVNDSDCLTFENLSFGDYYYGQVSVNGSLWNVVKYNDQANMPVNNVFDMLLYSPELFNATTSDDSSRNINSDGKLEISDSKKDHTVVLLFSYNDPINQCLLPDLTSELSVQATLGQPFSYQITASSLSVTSFDIGTSTLPNGLSFDSNTGIISGKPSEAGAFFVDIKLSNSCGSTSPIRLTIYVNTPSGGGGGGGGGTPPTVITSGGGGGGGGNGAPIADNLIITNEKVVEVTNGVALVTWDTNLSATSQVGFGTYSVVSASSTEPFGYATSTEIINTLTQSHSMLIPISLDGTYYFRPVSRDSLRQVIGKEVILERGGGGSSSSCYYLYDYLKKGWDNNPVEVKKLQVFLRDLEGFDVQITGIYDDQTIKALNAFQERYKADILTPWGHTSATSFTYITTKKKVNEIYCKMAFPLTLNQEQEIEAFRNFLNSLKAENITLPTDQTIDRNSKPTIINTDEVGLIDESGISTSTDLSTLAGVSIKTNRLANSVTATVLLSGKKIGDFFEYLFSLFSGNGQCKNCWYCYFVKIVLIIIIVILSYLLYKEKRAYKKLTEINKELDLIN